MFFTIFIPFYEFLWLLLLIISTFQYQILLHVASIVRTTAFDSVNFLTLKVNLLKSYGYILFVHIIIIHCIEAVFIVLGGLFKLMEFNGFETIDF